MCSRSVLLKFPLIRPSGSKFIDILCKGHHNRFQNVSVSCWVDCLLLRFDIELRFSLLGDRPKHHHIAIIVTLFHLSLLLHSGLLPRILRFVVALEIGFIRKNNSLQIDWIYGVFYGETMIEPLLFRSIIKENYSRFFRIVKLHFVQNISHNSTRNFQPREILNLSDWVPMPLLNGIVDLFNFISPIGLLWPFSWVILNSMRPVPLVIESRNCWLINLQIARYVFLVCLAYFNGTYGHPPLWDRQSPILVRGLWGLMMRNWLSFMRSRYSCWRRWK